MDARTLDLFAKYGINPNTPGLLDRERLPTEPVIPPPITPPITPVEPDQRERDFDWVERQNTPQRITPTYNFQAAPAPTAQSLSNERVSNDAPEALGGLAARFSVPTGKQGYSKSLRPEAGRLVR